MITSKLIFLRNFNIGSGTYFKNWKCFWDIPRRQNVCLNHMHTDVTNNEENFKHILERCKMIGNASCTIDPVTGITFDEMKKKIERGIPNIRLACHRMMGDMDSEHNRAIQRKQSARKTLELLEFTGGIYDISDVFQNMLQIDNDIDVMFGRCNPWPIKLHRNIIEPIPGTGVYCLLNITNYPKIQKQFPVVERDGKVYLSAAEFRQYYLERGDVVGADRLFELPKCLEDTEDTVGKASHVRLFRGQQPIDVVHYIPCIESKYYPKYSFWIQEERRFASEFGLVPKSRPEGDPDIEWRVSFTHLENKIIRETWSNDDLIAYILFKCIIKVHVGMQKYVTSYHLKLCMFLTQNLIPGVSKLDFSQRLLVLLDFLLYSVCSGFLPQPFIEHEPSINLFDKIPIDKLEIVTQKIKSFRHAIQDFPDDLGLYKSDINIQERCRKELVYLLSLNTVYEIERDVVSYKFVELRELFLDHETSLYMFESYLYKTLDKMGLKDATLVEDALNDPNLLRKRYEIILRNLRLSLIAGELFGYYEKGTSLKTKIEKRYQLWKIHGEGTVFYQTFNNKTFEMHQMPLNAGDNKNTQVICLSPDTETYGSTLALIKANTENKNNSYVFNSSPMMYIRPERTLVLNLWAARQLYFYNKGSFIKSGCPNTEYEIKMSKSMIRNIFKCATEGYYRI